MFNGKKITEKTAAVGKRSWDHPRGSHSFCPRPVDPEMAVVISQAQECFFVIPPGKLCVRAPRGTARPVDQPGVSAAAAAAAHSASLSLHLLITALPSTGAWTFTELGSASQLVILWTRVPADPATSEVFACYVRKWLFHREKAYNFYKIFKELQDPHFPQKEPVTALGLHL